MIKRSGWKHIVLAGGIVLGSANLGLAAGTPAQACSASKHKVIGKYVAGILNCYAKAIGKGEAVDSDCIAKVTSKASLAFSKVESGGGCATSGDFSTLAARANAFIGAIHASLPTAPFPVWCSDAIKDVDETGVDCGGSCAPCP